jgi:predicted RNA-binding protein (TIGR00451 family)
MAKLIRTKAGPFKLKDSIKWEDVFELYRKYMKSKDDKLIQKLIRPIEEAVNFLPKVWVDDDVLPRLKNGSPIFAPGIVQVDNDIKVGDIVACYTTKSKLASVGFAEMDSKQMIKEKKGMAVKTDVVML